MIFLIPTAYFSFQYLFTAAPHENSNVRLFQVSHECTNCSMFLQNIAPNDEDPWASLHCHHCLPLLFIIIIPLATPLPSFFHKLSSLICQLFLFMSSSTWLKRCVPGHPDSNHILSLIKHIYYIPAIMR